MIEELKQPDVFGKPELLAPIKKKKNKKPPFSRTFVLVIIISFFVGSFSGIATSLIINGVINPSSFFAPSIISSNNNQPVNNQPANEKIFKDMGLNEEAASIEVVKKASPAVVSIVVSEEVPQYNINEQFNDFFNGLPFEFQIPQQNPQQAPQSTQKQEVGRGTGFIISSDGLILTNKHVVTDDKAEYSIITNDGKELQAKILATDPLNDIAFLKVETTNLPYLKLGDSSKINIGQTVIAIGYALGEFRNTVTKGVISGIGRKIIAGGGGNVEQLEDVIQTDAAINPGNSGGPLLNLNGEVIGINTAISQQGQLIGFAIPINVAKSVAESVKTSGKIIRPFLGIRYLIINDDLAKQEKLPVNYGALIIRGQSQTELAVTPGSAADKAGLIENDIILEINGQKITSDSSLAKMIQNFKVGQTITLKVLSKGSEKTIKVTLEEYKE